MKRNYQYLAGLGLVLAVVVGCSKNVDDKPTINIDISDYLLTEEPKGAETVIQAREKTKDGDEVVIVGRIGGERNPWRKDRAGFTIIDQTLKDCNQKNDDGCEKPWDYCCEKQEDITASIASVRVVDEKGDTLKAGAKDLFNLKELQTVVVRGKAKRDNVGNLTILATGVFVKE